MLWTVFATLNGGIFFQEEPRSYLGFVFGMAGILAGVVMLSGPAGGAPSSSSDSEIGSHDEIGSHEDGGAATVVVSGRNALDCLIGPAIDDTAASDDDDGDDDDDDIVEVLPLRLRSLLFSPTPQHAPSARSARSDDDPPAHEGGGERSRHVSRSDDMRGAMAVGGDHEWQ